ncbi:MAG: hypothetical protein ACFFDT_29285 [Candidatus Hodarchaeota archaeon]
MTTIWFNHFKKQISKQTGHPLSPTEEDDFARVGNIIVKCLVCFTNVFIREVRKKFIQKHGKDVNREFENFFKHIKISIVDSFRNALIPSISHNEPFSLTRFAVLLNNNIKKHQSCSLLKFLPDYRIIHAFEIEEVRNGLTTVLGGFAFDCEPPREVDWVFFDLKISNHKEILTKFVRHGKEYHDLLELDSLGVFDQSLVNESAYAETHV